MSTSSDPTSFATPFELSLFAAVNLQDILYGIELLLYFKTMRILLARERACKKSNIFYASFSTVMVFLITVWIVTETLLCGNMWLLHPRYPGGPDAYWSANASSWYSDWGTASVLVLQLITDALMIYRCLVVWNNYRAIILPIILWLATLVLGFFTVWFSSIPGGNFFVGVAAEIGLMYFGVSVFLNLFLTSMICYYIVRHGRRIQEHVGHEDAFFYFSIAAVVVESMLPYTLSGIAFLISLGMNSPTSAAFTSVYILMMSISPQMLILRVIAGRAWPRNTLRAPRSLIKFNAGTTDVSEISANSRAPLHSRALSARRDSRPHDMA